MKRILRAMLGDQNFGPHNNAEGGDEEIIPHICHGRHGQHPCKFFLAGVNFYRFKAKNWQFTVYFAVITQKIGNFLCILS